jgi:hypothetical protein
VRPLPPLGRTPKHVILATSLRVPLLMRWWKQRMKVGMDPDELVRRVENPVNEIREAGFWIDHRDVALGDLEKVLHDVEGALPNAGGVSSDFVTKTNYESDNNRCNDLHEGSNR